MKQTHFILCVASFVALSSELCSAALRAPLPEFKSSQQLIAGKHEHISQPGDDDSASHRGGTFYTGKPYDVQCDGYLFKYRNYDPELNRWTSMDPTGFPDGVNNCIYPSSPVSAFDPNGAEKQVTVTANPSIPTASGSAYIASISGPNKGDIYGSLSITWGSTATTSGWIVQKIHYDWNITRDSDGSEWTPPEFSEPLPEPTTYWEAWRVTVDKSGLKITGDEKGDGPNGDDYTTPTFLDTTSGYFNILGEYGFYSDAQVTGNAPPSWGHQAGPAGDLYSTVTQPGWWGSVSGLHDLYLSWE